MAPRPWPQRSQELSPQRGRRFAIADRDVKRRQVLEQALTERGLFCVPLQESPELVLWIEPDETGDPTVLSRDSIIVCSPDASPLPGLEVWSQLSLPFDPDALLATFGQALEQRALSAENAKLRAQLAERQALGPLTASDPGMREVIETASAVADTHATILILSLIHI